MKRDRLHEILHEMLHQTHDLTESASSLIQRVSSSYALELQKMGEIPFAFLDDVLTDLEAETLEMYRKKTYGFFSLQEYRQARVTTRSQKGS